MNIANTLNSMDKVLNMYKSNQITLNKFRNCIMQMEVMLEEIDVPPQVAEKLDHLKNVARNLI